MTWRRLNLIFACAVVWAALGVWTFANGESAVMPLAFGAFWLLVALLDRSRWSRRGQGAEGERP